MSNVSNLELMRERCTIVLPGAWNRSILTPQWLAQTGIVTTNQANHEIEFEVQPPYTLRIRGHEATLTLVPGYVLLAASETDKSGFQRLQSAAIALVDALPRTPVRGVGLNFAFRSKVPSPELKHYLAGLGTADLTPNRVQFSGHDQNPQANVILEIQDQPICEVNFHLSEVHDGATASNILHSHQAWNLLPKAEQIARRTLKEKEAVGV